MMSSMQMQGYHYIKTLGDGLKVTAYLYEDKEGRRWVLRKPKRGYQQDAIREGKLLERLQGHPSLPEIRYVDKQILMEFLDTPYEPLAQCLGDKAIEGEMLWGFIKACLEFLSYLHECGIEYVDVKWDHFWWNHVSSALKVIDFNLAREHRPPSGRERWVLADLRKLALLISLYLQRKVGFVQEIPSASRPIPFPESEGEEDGALFLPAPLDLGHDTPVEKFLHLLHGGYYGSAKEALEGLRAAQENRLPHLTEETLVDRLQGWRIVLPKWEEVERTWGMLGEPDLGVQPETLLPPNDLAAEVYLWAYAIALRQAGKEDQADALEKALCGKEVSLSGYRSTDWYPWAVWIIDQDNRARIRLRRILQQGLSLKGEYGQTLENLRTLRREWGAKSSKSVLQEISHWVQKLESIRKATSRSVLDLYHLDSIFIRATQGDLVPEEEDYLWQDVVRCMEHHRKARWRLFRRALQGTLKEEDWREVAARSEELSEKLEKILGNKVPLENDFQGKLTSHLRKLSDHWVDSTAESWLDSAKAVYRCLFPRENDPLDGEAQAVIEEEKRLFAQRKAIRTDFQEQLASQQRVLEQRLQQVQDNYRVSQVAWIEQLKAVEGKLSRQIAANNKQLEEIKKIIDEELRRDYSYIRGLLEKTPGTPSVLREAEKKIHAQEKRRQKQSFALQGLVPLLVAFLVIAVVLVAVFGYTAYTIGKSKGEHSVQATSIAVLSRQLDILATQVASHTPVVITVSPPTATTTAVEPTPEPTLPPFSTLGEWLQENNVSLRITWPSEQNGIDSAQFYEIEGLGSVWGVTLTDAVLQDQPITLEISPQVEWPVRTAVAKWGCLVMEYDIGLEPSPQQTNHEVFCGYEKILNARLRMEEFDPTQQWQVRLIWQDEGGQSNLLLEHKVVFNVLQIQKSTLFCRRNKLCRDGDTDVLRGLAKGTVCLFLGYDAQTKMVKCQTKDAVGFVSESSFASVDFLHYLKVIFTSEKTSS